MALITCARSAQFPTHTETATTAARIRGRKKKRIKSSHLKVETGQPKSGSRLKTSTTQQQQKKTETRGKRKEKQVNKINFIHQQGRQPRLDYCKTSPKKCCKCLASSGVCGRWQVVGGGRWQVAGLASKRAFDTRRVCILRAAGEWENGEGKIKDPGAALWALFYTYPALTLKWAEILTALYNSNYILPVAQLSGKYTHAYTHAHTHTHTDITKHL